MPIVEPEVLMDGTHSVKRCAAVTAAALLSLFAEPHDFEVALNAIVLKPRLRGGYRPTDAESYALA